MKPGPRRSLLQCKLEEMGGIESVYRRPAIESVADIRRDALFTCNADQQWNEAVIAVTVDRWWQTYHGHAHATRRHRSGCLFRSYAGNGTGCGHIFFGSEAATRKKPGPRGDDQGAVRASERRAESLNGVPVCLTV